MIVIGLGANLPSRLGGPRATLEAVLERLGEAGAHIVARSAWYESAPVPASDQPWFVNGVAAVETDLSPAALLALLHGIEADIGRVRGERNAPRCVDLDIIDHDGRIDDRGPPILPHPRLAERAFVLLPLAEIAPDWKHPVSGAALDDLIAALPKDQEIRRIPS